MNTPDSVFFQSSSILSLLGTSEFKHFRQFINSDKEVFTLQDFDLILRNASLKPEDLEFFNAGRWMDGSLLTCSESVSSGFKLRELSKNKILAAVQSGYSLRLNEIQRHNALLAEFVESISRLSPLRISLNAYFTLSGQSGLAPHHDNQDILILQISGRKHWYLGPAAVADFQQAAPTLTLNAGDVLFIPRNMPHAAACSDAHSLHLTLGFSDRHWKDFISYVHSETPLRRLLDGAISSDPATRLQQLKLLAQTLQTELSQTETLEDFLHRSTYEKADTGLQSFFNLKDD